MSYLSDDEEEIAPQDTTYDINSEEDIEEMEALRLLRDAMNKRDDTELILSNVKSNKSDKSDKSDKSRKDSKKVKKTKTIEEINVELNKKIIESTPQKWKSSRAEEKKGEQIPIIKKDVNKRCFNPRLPPYNTVAREKKEIQFIDMEDNESFPQL
jgi:hypothetical protein